MQLPESELRARAGTAELLARRERQSLRLSIFARLALIAAVALVVMPLTGQGHERLVVFLVIALIAVHQLVLLKQLSGENANLRRAGWACAALDSLILVALPVLWYSVYTAPDVPLAHLTRHNYTAVCVMIMVLNVAALRPALPAFVSGVAVLAHVVLAVLSVVDPRLEAYPGGLHGALGVGLSTLDIVFITPFFLLVAGAVLTFATQVARSTLLDAVALEQAERDARERQLEAVLDARMAAVGSLVAGLEHEVNSPLGALHSATDTSARVASKLRESLSPESLTPPVQRALVALENTTTLSQQASARMQEVMGRIRGFVQLDAADLQRVDLKEVLENVIELNRRHLRQDTDLVVDVASGLIAEADPRRLSQAFSTVLQNAAESFEHAGTLRIEAKKDGTDALIRVADQGHGMSAEQLVSLFEVGFDASSRVRARFGLPSCRSILHRHGGSVDVQSEVGQGTTVTLRVPLLDLSAPD